MSEQPTHEPDADLDREDLRDRHGNRVTREYVSALAQEALEQYLRRG